MTLLTIGLMTIPISISLRLAYVRRRRKKHHQKVEALRKEMLYWRRGDEMDGRDPGYYEAILNWNHEYLYTESTPKKGESGLTSTNWEELSAHPAPSSKMYSISWKPAPAIAGKNTFPTIPEPLKVPPEGVPTNVSGSLLAQYVVPNPVKLTTATGVTVVLVV